MGARVRNWRCAVAVLIAVAAGGLATPAAWAEDYCCTCKGKKKGKNIDADDDFAAGMQCTLECRRPTLPKPGKCQEAPKPTTPAAAPTPAPATATGTVLLFASEDCSGDATRVAASTAGLPDGLRSFSVESGGPASVWEDGDYSGRRTRPVGPTICVSPGWEIGSLRLGE